MSIKLVIYGKEQCSECDELKAYLDSKGTSYKYLELEKNYSREELMEIKPASVRKFPVTFLANPDGTRGKYVNPSEVIANLQTLT